MPTCSLLCARIVLGETPCTSHEPEVPTALQTHAWTQYHTHHSYPQKKRYLHPKLLLHKCSCLPEHPRAKAQLQKTAYRLTPQHGLALGFQWETISDLKRLLFQSQKLTERELFPAHLGTCASERQNHTQIRRCTYVKMEKPSQGFSSSLLRGCCNPHLPLNTCTWQHVTTAPPRP